MTETIEDLQKKLEKSKYIINKYNECLKDIKFSLNRKDKIKTVKEHIDNNLGILEMFYENYDMNIQDLENIEKEVKNKIMNELLKEEEMLKNKNNKQ